MKRLSFNLFLLTIAFLGIQQTAFAQWNLSPNPIYPTNLNAKVGIGTITPAQKLHVVGGNILVDYSDVAASTGNLFFGNITYPNTTLNGMRMSYFNSAGTGFKNGYIDVRTVGGTANDGLVFRLDNNTTSAGTERMRICANGRVGIGTGVPDQKLHVGGGNIMLDNSDVSATTGSIFFGGVTYPANQNGMRISYFNGPSFKNGYIDVRTTALTDGIVFRVDGPAGNNERMRICANGNVGIGAIPGVYKLYVNGNTYVSGTLFVASDNRFKKDVRTFDGALAKVNRLRGVQYEYRQNEFSDHSFQAGKTDGFIAQELREVLPELVHEGADGYLAVNYQGIIPVLTEAVKELKAEKDQQLSEMETRLAEKDRQISALEARLAKLEAAFDRAASPNVEARNFLMSNQPNPFSGTTTIKCTIPETVRTAELVVVDLAGREITRQIVAERGQINTEINLATAPTGTYICTLIADGNASGTLKLAVQGK